MLTAEKKWQNQVLLTSEELALVEQLMAGLTISDIARHYAISNRACRYRIEKIKDKMGVNSLFLLGYTFRECFQPAS